jgi:hypothetical protein
MVAHNKVAASLELSEIKKRAPHLKKSREAPKWRSTGWTPLTYPASALVVDAMMTANGTFCIEEAVEGNPLFPLDNDVVQAAIREMLILEGSIEADTLKLNEDRKLFRKSSDAQMTQGADDELGLGPVFTSHVYPSIWKRCKENHIFSAHVGDEVGIDSRYLKRKMPEHVSKKAKRRMLAEKQSESFGEADSVEKIETSITCAETLVALILDRARLEEYQACIPEPVLSTNDRNEPIDSENAGRPPRKVSDVDHDSTIDRRTVLFDLTGESCGVQDMSLFIDLTHRTKNGSVAFHKGEIPAFLDVSISFESTLRNLAYRMISEICLSFEDEPIRMFLGYKSGALKRERVVQMLSDYLFDVSHAMFAWKQTEIEVTSQRTGAVLSVQTSFLQEVDSLVRDSLFDERALRKIGGLDDSSILRHAIEISRCKRRKETWENFAKTATGRRLLSHHRSGTVHLVGQKRRGQRVKQFASSAASCDTSEEGQRSRASSIASYEEIDHNLPCLTEICDCNHKERSFVAPYGTTIHHLSEVIEMTLTRKSGESWGVLLSREGDMCVVDRAPADGLLFSGDLILSVRNDRGESATPPALSSQAQGVDWFKDVVNVFKGSNELRLNVRRVGC